MQKIIIDPDVCNGKPSIRGQSITVIKKFGLLPF